MVKCKFKGLHIGAGKGACAEGAVQTMPEARLQAVVSRGTESSGGMVKSVLEGEKMQVGTQVSSESLNLSNHKSRETVMRCPSAFAGGAHVSLAAITLESNMCNATVGTRLCLSSVFSLPLSQW